MMRYWLAGAVLVVGCVQTRDEDSGMGVPTSEGADGGTTSATEGDAGSTASAPDDDGEVKLDVAPAQTDGDDPDDNPACDQDIDIVFVMDVSTSMGPFLATLANEIIVVDQALANLGLPNAPHYGLVVFVDDTALLAGGAAYADVNTLQADFNMWSTFTASNQQVAGGNANTTWPENSLDALYAAATGFQWRDQDDTLRVIIHTTDDTFWEGPATQNGVMIDNDYAGTVDALQTRSIRVFTFAAQIGGSCNCEDVTPGWSAPYQAMPAVPEATDGNVFDIDLVLAGQVSLADAINDSIEESMCDPYDPVG